MIMKIKVFSAPTHDPEKLEQQFTAWFANQHQILIRQLVQSQNGYTIVLTVLYQQSEYSMGG